MKLKEWLQTFKNMTYQEYQALDMFDQISLQVDFREYNKSLQRKKAAKEREKALIASGELIVRPETEADRKQREAIVRRYEESLAAGGVNGNHFIALHHRWDKDGDIAEEE